MGRWDYTVFGGDTDMEIVSYVEEATGVSIQDNPQKLEEARMKLDAGLGTQLLREWREKEKDESWGMEFLNDPIGAKISADDREHLKANFDKCPGKNGYVSPLADEGFRSVGRVQYGAALEHYIDGQRRSFFEPCCYSCGKQSCDLGDQPLKICSRCDKNNRPSYYCNVACQKENWKEHKVICVPPRSNGHFSMMNV